MADGLVKPILCFVEQGYIFDYIELGQVFGEFYCCCVAIWWHCFAELNFFWNPWSIRPPSCFSNMGSFLALDQILRFLRNWFEYLLCFWLFSLVVDLFKFEECQRIGMLGLNYKLDGVFAIMYGTLQMSHFHLAQNFRMLLFKRITIPTSLVNHFDCKQTWSIGLIHIWIISLYVNRIRLKIEWWTWILFSDDR